MKNLLHLLFLLLLTAGADACPTDRRISAQDRGSQPEQTFLHRNDSSDSPHHSRACDWAGCPCFCPRATGVPAGFHTISFPDRTAGRPYPSWFFRQTSPRSFPRIPWIPPKING